MYILGEHVDIWYSVNDGEYRLYDGPYELYEMPDPLAPWKRTISYSYYEDGADSETFTVYFDSDALPIPEISVLEQGMLYWENWGGTLHYTYTWDTDPAEYTGETTLFIPIDDPPANASVLYLRAQVRDGDAVSAEVLFIFEWDDNS